MYNKHLQSSESRVGGFVVESWRCVGRESVAQARARARTQPGTGSGSECNRDRDQEAGLTEGEIVQLKSN